MRVLLIKTSSLGDVIHALPALTDAARAIPGIRFDWVVEEGFAEIPSWHPAVDTIIPVAIRRWRKNLWQTFKSGEWRQFKQRLRERKYDLVIDAQGLVKSAWLTRYVKAPVAGMDRYSAREGLSSRFYDRRLSVERGQHAVERVRQLFALALGYNLPAGLGDYGLDLNRLQLPPAAPFVVFLHGTTWATKHWPEAYWRQLAERLGQQGLQVRLPWGNPAEQARAERIAKGLANCQVLPKLNLVGVARVLAAAKACIAVDTGLGHLAAALDVPTLSLFGPTNPGLTGAYGKSQVHIASDFACAPCLQKKCTYKPSADDQRRFDLKREWPLCFTRLNPERVASQLRALLLAEDVR
ncbi:lipopolysaccharide heptosyltransferase I [Pseudomonas sp. NPDC087612]|uniref:Lipopolysaccharide heptosyltransferase 1 n=1 Tax=Pseudomonas vranovensis TaxID=321661 RepID=A0A423DVD8_9PSED|nr:MULTISPECIES: lipopolysaccharide heptosyltransferase I [Pseudomonas]KJK16403.1 ADP-heptose--LPS heptosyltransferase [Pseudomonas sp. 2(2015)]NLU58454.1 lipopolysaccharide heptosyltransferase I [Pseudomonas sp. BIGb0427]QPG64098.1 lipopolysaccharide heptosyltransferase I [Pseudomonas sp. BIGb0427]QVM97159.1 lipopolysaccharide heptosyltransferase I [Pseudomonas sp. SORT22]ROL76056.1 lipopolysaccharide heptosyltransferase I [Pseudomonas vranovensis]